MNRFLTLLAVITITPSQMVVPMGTYAVPAISVTGTPGSGLYFISGGPANPVGAMCFVDLNQQVAGCMDDEGTRLGATGAVRFSSGPVQGNFTFNNGGITTANTKDGTVSLCNGSCADNDHAGSLVGTNMSAYGNVRMMPGTVGTLPACTNALDGTLRSVTDSTSSAWGTTITGGGTSHVLAYCNGTTWTVR